MCEKNRFKFKLKPGYVHELLICSGGWRKIFLFMKRPAGTTSRQAFFLQQCNEKQSLNASRKFQKNRQSRTKIIFAGYDHYYR